MSIYIAALIMLAMGVLGGIINYILPANENPDGSKIRSKTKCILLGIGATFLVPLFLEIAQSKLMDKMNFGFSVSNSSDKADSSKRISFKNDTAFVRVYFLDSNRKKTDTVFPSKPKPGTNANTVTGKTSGDDPNLPKSYLLFAAYCFLAAAAGFRFINMLIDKVILQQELDKTKTENKELNKTVTRQAKVAEGKQEREEKDELAKLASVQTEAATAGHKIKVPVIKLPPVKHLDDPQKDRFGGKSENNGRIISAGEIEELKDTPDWYKFKIWVKSSDQSKPLQGNVIFYLHNSFYKSVRTVPVVNGVAELALIKVYGAFTVGAIADDGETLLELDLSQLKDFPKKFRDR